MFKFKMFLVHELWLGIWMLPYPLIIDEYSRCFTLELIIQLWPVFFYSQFRIVNSSTLHIHVDDIIHFILLYVYISKNTM